MAKKKDKTGRQPDESKASQTPKAEVASGESNFRIVGIGASAGGLEAFEQFFSNMPSVAGMAFVIVQHLDPTGHSSMPQILSRFTKMPIDVATDGMIVKPNSIYLLPPNKSMGIHEGALYLQEPTRPPGLRLPIDFFFRSLAKEMGADAICIILSGTGTDGTLGLRAIKAELGTVFVQDPESARYDGMPRSAIDTGLADFVLKPDEMPEKLVQFVKHLVVNGAKFGTTTEEAMEPLKQIFAILKTRTGHDFSRYKQTTIRRRLQRRMSVNQINDVAEYALFLKKSEDEVKALLKDLLISVTNFFRDPEAFEALKRQMKDLIKNRIQGSDMRIWVAGCATGEEAYSVAMVIQECLDELEKHLQVQMYGTDIDVEALHVARTGKYPGNIASDVTPERLKRFFIKENDTYRVKKEIRELIVFAPQNFIKDPPFSKMDLICCRNLLIYLESDVQKRLLPLLHYALKPGGILFLGPSETTGESADLFTLVDRKWKVYQRREALVPAERLKFPAAFAPNTRLATGEPVQEVIEPRIPELTEKIFLDNYAPTFAVIDEKYRLVYVRGRTGRYLEIASGQPTWTILDMAREGLRTELTSSVYRAISEKRKIVHDGVRIKTNGGYQTVNLTVTPLTEPGVPPGLIMIVFQEVGPDVKGVEVKPAARSRKRVVELEDELRLTKENLQTTIEELEATNEELKSANEELQSNNEELQSTNEELDTSREELQSLNEELTTLNAELQDKNELLSKANDDLKNFLNRTDIAIIFLDEELKIRSYTPATSDVFNVRDIDVGRPLGEITPRLEYDGIVKDSLEVLRTLQPKDIEVQRKDGAWYKMRILPYLTAQNIVSGLVMSFLDIDKQKKAAGELLHLNVQLEDLAKFPQENPNPVMRVDKNGKILLANPACLILDSFKCQTGQTLPRHYKKIIVEVLETGSPQLMELKGKEHIFSLDFVPITKSGYVNIYGSDTTDRKKAEENLRETRDYLDNLINYANAPIIVWNPKLEITRFNHAFERLTGRTAEEMMGKKVDILIPKDRRKDALEKINRATVKGERWLVVEIPVQHADGSVRTVQWNSATLFESDGKTPMSTIAQGTDITERKRAEEALKESEEQFRAIAETSPISIGIADSAEGTFLFVNPAYEKMFGYDPGELPGRKTEGIFQSTADRDSLLQILKDKGYISDYELEMKRKDGSSFWGLASIRPINFSGKTALLGMSIDITERKQVEQLKDDFIGMVSHELRTPLTVIIGALATARDERASKEEKKELMAEASSSAESLASILANMLELSRYQAGRLNLEKKPVRIADIVEKAVGSVHRKYDTSHIVSDIEDKIPEVDADALRIEQVLYNLLENAVKYSPEGSEVRIFSQRDKNNVVIGVSDHGIGISAKDQQKLFESFSRLRARRTQGVGLGLVVCKHLVEAHGGHIWVESEPNKGSTFLFSIPAERRRAKAQRTV